MFIGRECYKHTDTLSQLLFDSNIRAKASSKWLQPLLKVYVFMFGVPEIGLQLRASYFRKNVACISFNRALDAGCGIGLNSIYLAKKHPSAMIDACDIMPKLVQAASLLRDDQRLNNLAIFSADLTQLAVVNKYDLIFCLDAIEHIPDDILVFEKFKLALKEGGLLVLSTPHKRHVKRRFKGIHYDSLDHVRDGYTEDELRRILQTQGFDFKECYYGWGFWGEYCDELYHWTLLHLPRLMFAFIFPILSVFSSLDLLMKNQQGYWIMVKAQKKNN